MHRPDGTACLVRHWRAAAPRGVVLMVHGLGEHSGRYAHVAQRLLQWGYSVRAYDQWGHGQSSGSRGGLPLDSQLLDDLAWQVDEARAAHPGLPLILLGHSMGGLVVARFVGLRLRPVDGLVLSSPALNPGLNPVQKLLVAVLPRLLPSLRVKNGLQVSHISHDEQVVAQYVADPLVHPYISARLGAWIAAQAPLAVASASSWSVPTLLLYAGADKLVNAQGSRDFVRLAPSSVVQSQCFDGLYHEIFNERPELAQPVFAALQAWLAAR
ncbi:alpha/beta hydrolase [Curvibacter sp. CHRR-16]|uniref:alpha/beta hydrolase n=1 Tax=Curvibacter sp. CHRR-16 TaxID=2835872 RepID=UPI002023A04B|nr:alpha/beta hydrolase [Curvibacter sp. CHRR-16]